MLIDLFISIILLVFVHRRIFVGTSWRTSWRTSFVLYMNFASICYRFLYTVHGYQSIGYMRPKHGRLHMLLNFELLLHIYASIHLFIYQSSLGCRLQQLVGIVQVEVHLMVHLFHLGTLSTADVCAHDIGDRPVDVAGDRWFNLFEQWLDRYGIATHIKSAQQLQICMYMYVCSTTAFCDIRRTSNGSRWNINLHLHRVDDIWWVDHQYDGGHVTSTRIWSSPLPIDLYVGSCHRRSQSSQYTEPDDLTMPDARRIVWSSVTTTWRRTSLHIARHICCMPAVLPASGPVDICWFLLL